MAKTDGARNALTLMSPEEPYRSRLLFELSAMGARWDRESMQALGSELDGHGQTSYLTHVMSRCGAGDAQARPAATSVRTRSAQRDIHWRGRRTPADMAP